MLEHHKAAHIAAAATQVSSSTTSTIHAVFFTARAQKSGMARLDTLDNALKRTLSHGSKVMLDSNTSEPTSLQLANTKLSTEEAKAAECHAVELDEQVVDSEIHQYKTVGILIGNELDDFDILQYWQVSFSCSSHSESVSSTYLTPSGKQTYFAIVLSSGTGCVPRPHQCLARGSFPQAKRQQRHAAANLIPY
jgi:hypothetical protein